MEITKDGLIYTGLATGEVVTVDMAGNVKRIALIGNVTDESICSIYIFDNLKTKEQINKDVLFKKSLVAPVCLKLILNVVGHLD